MSFRAQIIVGLVLIQGLFLAVLVFAGMQSIEKTANAELVQHANTAAELISRLVKEPVLTVDLATLEEIVTDVSSEMGLTFVRIVNDTGIVLAETKKSAEASSSAPEFVKSTPIMVANNTFGMVTIGASSDFVADAIKDARQQFIVIAIVGIVLTSVFSFILATYLRRRLVALEEGAKRIGRGELGLVIGSSGYDEVSRVTGAFNKMSQRLRETEDRFKAISANIPGAIFQRIVEPGGATYLTYFSDGARDMFGVTPQSLVEDNGLVKEVVHPEYYEGYFSAVRTAAETLTPLSVEYRLKDSDGDEKWVRATGSTRRLDNGDVVIDGLVFDITQDKEMDRIKSEFISIVSHELRTPLTSIKGALGLITTAGKDDISDKYRSMVDIAYRNSERLTYLVNDILDIEKIASGKMTLTLTVQPALDLIEQAVEATQSFAEQFNITVAVINDAPNAHVSADGVRLVQVITNLLSNAVKFEGDSGCVNCRISETADAVRIEVEDHGPGIAKSFQGHIFEKFSQEETSLIRQHEGTGLGLAISKALVEQHGGQIGFDTVEGQGTTFFVQLPRFDPVN